MATPRTDVHLGLLENTQHGRLRQAELVTDSLCAQIVARVVLDDLLPQRLGDSTTTGYRAW